MVSKVRLVKTLDEQSLAERSDMMRLYHSRLAGDAAYPAQFVQNAELLLDLGHIEPAGDGYRLTTSGIKAWAQLCRPLLASSSQSTGPQYNELRLLSGLPIHRISLDASSMAILEKLAGAGGTLLLDQLDDISHNRLSGPAAIIGLPTLLRATYAVTDGKTATLTAVGWHIVAEMNMHIVQPVDRSQGEITIMTETCKEPDCNQPRMQKENGGTHPRCEEHQREQWRKYHAKGSKPRTKAKPKTKLTPKPFTPPAQAAPVEQPPTPDPAPVEQPEPSVIQFQDDLCEAQALAIDVLREKFPDIDDLVRAKRLEIEARRKLGL